jgi:protein ImuB
MRRVISLWLPRFATQRRRPSAPAASPASGAPADAGDGESRPLALVSGEGGRQALTAVDARAAAAGLAPGLPLAEARAQLPELDVQPADPDGDAAALKRLAAWCGRYSPWTAPDPMGGEGGGAGVWIDATGCAHLFGGEAAMLADLCHRLGRLGLTARAAMADTPGAAWALARFATDARLTTLVAPEGALRGYLSPLPPAALRLDAADCELLHRLGLRRVGDLLDVPPAALAPRVGRQVARRLDQALGRVSEPIDPLSPVPPLRVRRAFAEPIGTRDDLAAAIEALIAGLCRRLEEVGQGARRLELTLYRVDGSLQPVQLGTSRASREADHLKRLFAERLDDLDAGFGVEVMTLAATHAERLQAGQLALGRKHAGNKGAGELAGLIDRLEARLGGGAVTRPRPRGSHLPERAVAAGPAFADRASQDGKRQDWPATGPRPVRLVEPPQPLDATAAVPDGPPAQIRLSGLTHRVAGVQGPERLSPEWWRPHSPEGQGGRDYYRLETAEGRRYWVFRSGNRWYLHGLFA